MTNDNLESDQAREERLREKLKRKASSMKSKEETKKDESQSNESNNNSSNNKDSHNIKDSDNNNNNDGKTNNTTSKNQNRDRNTKRRQRPDRDRDRGTSNYNSNSNSNSNSNTNPDSSHRNNGAMRHHDLPHTNHPYRDPYGRVDWRRDAGPGSNYDHHGHNRRNNNNYGGGGAAGAGAGGGGGASGGGWHNHNGGYNPNGYDYDHNHPAHPHHHNRGTDHHPYWRENRHADRDRMHHAHDSSSPSRNNRNDRMSGGSVNHNHNHNHNHHGMRKERGRSRSQSHSHCSSNSRRSDRSYRSEYSHSHSPSHSRSRSRSMSRSSRSRSESSDDRSRRSSVSRDRSRSMSRSVDGDRRKRSRSDDSQGSKLSARSAKKTRDGDTEEDDDLNENENNDDNDKEVSNKTNTNELTKDRRTIFVSQLVMKTQERDIKRHFKKVHGCKVNDVQLLRDKRTGRHKGCAYVELGRLEDVPRAVAASGKTPKFQRFPILVKASEAEKNYGVDGYAYTNGSYGSSLDVTNTGLTKRIEAQKVYIGSVDRNVTQAQLYAIFSQFGDLEKVTLQVDSTTGMSKGFAFLSYKDPKVANLAIQAMSGQVLAGRPLRTGWANLNTSVPNLEEVSSSEFPEDAVKRIAKVNEIFTKLNTTALAPLPSMSLIPGMGETNRIDLLKGVDEPPTTSSSTAAISTAAENAINAALGISAAADNLDSELVPANTPSEALVVDDPNEVKGKLSNNILVRNMFDKDEETEEGWEEDIRLDFEEESSKHGKIISVKVISKEPDGKIFASFETSEGAKACAENLAGRWFDKRQLRVEFVSDETFARL